MASQKSTVRPRANSLLFTLATVTLSMSSLARSMQLLSGTQGIQHFANGDMDEALDEELNNLQRETYIPGILPYSRTLRTVAWDPVDQSHYGHVLSAQGRKSHSHTSIVSGR